VNVERLVSMANDIGRYFSAEPEREDAIAGIASHLRRFWEPRMRTAIIAHLRDGGGAGLEDLARAGVERLASAG
jgi:formate dehydrogenase subunit delta